MAKGKRQSNLGIHPPLVASKYGNHIPWTYSPHSGDKPAWTRSGSSAGSERGCGSFARQEDFRRKRLR